nr:hypothetical protein [Tanacetum cinerariifolium]
MKEKKLVKKVNFRPLLNEEKIDNFDFVLSKYAMDDVKSRYENTLNYVNNTWSKFGLQKLMMSDDGKPPHCVDCKIFGHSLINCPKRAKDTIFSAPFMAATNTATVEDYEEGFIEGVGNAHAKASFLKSNDYKNSSPSYVKSTMSAPLENTFDVFSSVEEDICGTIVQGMTQVDGDGGHNPKVCEPNGSGTQKPILSDYNKSMNEEVEKIQDKRSLWSRFKEMNEASTSKAKSSMVDLEDESDEDCWD